MPWILYAYISERPMRMTTKCPVIPAEFSVKKAIGPRLKFRFQLELDISTGFNAIILANFSRDHRAFGCHPHQPCRYVRAAPKTKISMAWWVERRWLRQRNATDFNISIVQLLYFSGDFRAQVDSLSYKCWIRLIWNIRCKTLTQLQPTLMLPRLINHSWPIYFNLPK